MIKIAMYSTSQLFGQRITGGLKRFLELYKGLVNNNFDVDLFCADSPDVLKKVGIQAYSLINTGKSNNLFIPTELKLLINNMQTIKKIRSAKYDLVIVFDVPTAIGLCIMGVKHISLFIRQDLISYKKILLETRTNSKIKRSLYLRFMQFCELICCIKAKHIIIQCKYDYNMLSNRHKLIKNIIQKKSIIQINNVNPSWIIDNSISDDKYKFLVKDDKRKNVIRIGFIGDFSNERKGQRIFVDSVKALLDKGLKLEAILIGGGEQLLNYKRECLNYPTIKFTGRLSNPIPIMRQCDLIVVPSLADSCPNTIMEALYNEIPVIGARSGGIPEILQNENSLFEPDAISLGKKIEFFLNKDNLNELKISQQIRKRELEFDWPLVIIKHLNIK